MEETIRSVQPLCCVDPLRPRGQAHLYQSGLKGVFLKRRDAPADRLYFDKAFIYALVTRPRQSIVVLSPCYAVCHL